MQQEVERILTLAAGGDRVWDAVECGAWLGDDAMIDPRPGGDGWVRDGGRLRHLVIEDIEPGRRLVFRWWALDPDGVGPASRVHIELEPSEEEPDHTRVVVVEAPLVGGGGVPDASPQALAMAGA